MPSTSPPLFGREGKMTLHNVVLAVGIYTLVMCAVRIVMALMGDRTGNSGRYKMWDEED